jgi:hypothetical protein
MKVRIINGSFVNIKILMKLTTSGPAKDSVLVKISNVAELSKKVSDIGAVEVETIGYTCVFKEGD